MTVSAITDTAVAARRQAARLLLADDPPPRYGRPSNYSLTTAELAAHIRELRRAGWQRWELNCRFTFGRTA